MTQAFLTRDVAIHVDERGSGAPVVLIHGTAARLWGRVQDDLARSSRAIAYDRRSFGLSQHALVKSLSVHAEDAAALLEGLGAAPAILVGWSIGGVIALEVAMRWPERVRGLVLIEPPLHATQRPTLSLLNGVVGSILRGAFDKASGGRRFARWVFAEQDGRNALDRIPADWRTALDDNAAAVGSEIGAGTGEHLTKAELAKIQVPTVCLVGERSRPFFAVSAEHVRATLPRCELRRVEGTGHFMQHDRPDAIVSTVRDLVHRQSS